MEANETKKSEPVQVHCSECERGGNGDKSCGSGWMVTNKRGDNRYRMCFAGKRLAEPATTKTEGVA